MVEASKSWISPKARRGLGADQARGDWQSCQEGQVQQPSTSCPLAGNHRVEPVIQTWRRDAGMRCSRPTTGTNLRFSTAQELATRPVQICDAAETVGGVLAQSFYYVYIIGFLCRDILKRNMQSCPIMPLPPSSMSYVKKIMTLP